ncbi:MAG: hypothetical protein OXR66_09605 [Candidatus Woesearchaeota archaeon]|nr:hypothetical protein [Candidatus Woesearchaeota archaeon]
MTLDNIVQYDTAREVLSKIGLQDLSDGARSHLMGEAQYHRGSNIDVQTRDGVSPWLYFRRDYGDGSKEHVFVSEDGHVLKRPERQSAQPLEREDLVNMLEKYDHTRTGPSLNPIGHYVNNLAYVADNVQNPFLRTVGYALATVLTPLTYAYALANGVATAGLHKLHTERNRLEYAPALFAT